MGHSGHTWYGRNLTDYYNLYRGMTDSLQAFFLTLEPLHFVARMIFLVFTKRDFRIVEFMTTPNLRRESLNHDISFVDIVDVDAFCGGL